MSSESTQAASSFPPGSPCWIEIMSSNPLKLKEFYAAVFPDWKFRGDEEADPHVVSITFAQPNGLSGGFVKMPEGIGERAAQAQGVGFTVYYMVDSVDEMEKHIVKLGGVKVLDKKPEAENGWFANFKDPEGHRFGIYEVNKSKKM